MSLKSSELGILLGVLVELDTTKQQSLTSRLVHINGKSGCQLLYLLHELTSSPETWYV